MLRSRSDSLRLHKIGQKKCLVYRIFVTKLQGCVKELHWTTDLHQYPGFLKEGGGFATAKSSIDGQT